MTLPHGERGLKSLCKIDKKGCRSSRSPHGERGLKFVNKKTIEKNKQKSLPPRGAWIEIKFTTLGMFQIVRRSPHGERGLKSAVDNSKGGDSESLPPRGAWIEIKVFGYQEAWASVAPPTGSVD